MHIAVFSQYHTNPDCPATSRHYSLLTQLAAVHRVTLISTRTWEPQRLTREFAWVPAGVDLRAADIAYENQMGVARRALSFGQYAAYALREGLRIDTPDVIWGISTPLTAAWAAAQVARWRRVPWVFEVQDLWPAFPVAMGAVPSRLARQELYRLEGRLYQQARAIMTLSPDMTEHVRQIGQGRRWPFAPEKVHTTLNGTDFDLAARATAQTVTALRREQGLTGKRVVLYAGTFGRANDIPLLLAAADLLAATHPEVVWLFMGHGFYAEQVAAAARRHSYIRVVAAQPRHAVFTWFRLADVAVVPFLGLPVLDANSPAKFYDSLAVGTPVVVTNSGWTRELVERHGCGWYSPAGNAPALAQRLSELLAQPEQLHLAGQRGQQVAQAQFDRQRIGATMQQILEQAAQGGR
ncbi:glycosyltransferase family 4 protein [Hymenobacter rubripertinctus]|uniref:Glycosyltransferase WbuB n=1 Tax=Hymenobacter rubripertinctus TaxID=2029981 RepID=A0A418QYI0_9BACT|nr:glycosyltransferase family 4 protein [Hymenobacter rubripertinctus]RIY10212.1 glycosyltransferase WbuB [Hymenobacter rubripertinctus]